MGLDYTHNFSRATAKYFDTTKENIDLKNPKINFSQIRLVSLADQRGVGHRDSCDHYDSWTALHLV